MHHQHKTAGQTLVATASRIDIAPVGQRLASGALTLFRPQIPRNLREVKGLGADPGDRGD
jgi:hypothetical protein